MSTKELQQVNNESETQEAKDLLDHMRLLEKEKSELAKSNEDLVKSMAGLQQANSQLLSYIHQLRHRQFGRKSEKLDGDTALLPAFENIFDEAVVVEEETTAPSPEQNKPPKKKRGRRPLPEDLPRERVIHDIPEAQKQCSCGHQLSEIGEETSEQLEFIPASLKVITNVRKKYACRACEEGVILAPLPAQPLPKSIAAPGLLSHVLVSKYADHLPLYRQSQMWERLGVEISRATMCQWVLKCGELLSPLVDLLKADITSSDYVQADETGLQVLKEKNRKATSKSYMWVYKTGPSQTPAIVYDYSPSRKGEVAQEFLSNFKGYLQTDCYAAYKNICKSPSITSVGCWAHARRKFVEITKLAKKPGKAAEAVEMIGQLYKAEKHARDTGLPPDKIKDLRQEQSKPILDDFKIWLESHVTRAPPKHPLGKAIRYTLKNWDSLTRYLDDGRLNIDNNACERAIRPFAVGRKNWMFMGNERGACAGANIYSLIETCKANGVEPCAYLRHVLKHIRTSDNLSELLPYNLKQSLLHEKPNFNPDS